MKLFAVCVAVFYTGVIVGAFAILFWVGRSERPARPIERPRGRMYEARSMAVDLRAHPKVRPISERVLCDRDVSEPETLVARLRRSGL